MPRGKANNGNSGPPCAFCTNGTPSGEAVNCCKCSEIAHRYCAGVSMKEFKDSNSPYICVSCQKAAYIETIDEMKDAIAALKSEVSELRAALSTITEQQQQVEQCPRHTTHGSSQSWVEVVRRGKRRPNRTQQRAGRSENQGTDARIADRDHTAAEDGVQRSRRTARRARTQVAGARKIWGTHKSTTTGEVKGAISMLAGIPTDDLVVKRKFKVAPGNSRWWFVLRAEESVLKGLEETWSTIALPRRWKLEPLLCYAEADDGPSQLQTRDTDQERNSSVAVDLNVTSGIDNQSVSESPNTQPPASSHSMVAPNPTNNSDLPTQASHAS